MERISSGDAAFLRHEGPDHLHIGGIARFAGPPPSQAELLTHVRARLGRVPRYRQRPASAIGPLARVASPRWIDDPTFNLEYHVRHTALPAPGSDELLRRLAARIFSQALDRTKPLWELWIVEGLEGDGWALIAKTHHALVDGETGVALMAELLDADPAPAAEEPVPAWHARPEPSPAELTADALESLLTRAALPRAGLRAARSTLGTLSRALAGASESPLREPITPHRRVAELSVPLADVKAAATLGATVNDVVLASVAGGLRFWLHERGRRTEGVPLVACVPIAVEGGRIRHAFAPLPVTLDDPLARLEAIQEALADVKSSLGASPAGAIADADAFNAPTLLAQASRLDLDPRAYDLLVTNIPGPKGPRYVLGRELASMVPLGFLGADRILAIACMSYRDQVHFGLLGDYDALPDLEVLRTGIANALADLVAATQDRVHPTRNNTPSA